MRTVAIRILVILALLGTATLPSPPEAHVAPPTRIVDETADVVCTGSAKTWRSRSVWPDQTRPARRAPCSCPTPPTVGRRSAASTLAPVDWGEGTFRAAIPVGGRGEEEGELVGEVYFPGTTPAGEPQVIRDKFNAGNVHVVEEHIVTPLAISDVTLTHADNDTTPGDVTPTDLTRDGSAVEGSLFFTNPATLVQIGTGLFQDPAGCTTGNAEEYSIEGTLDELFVDVYYADRPRRTPAV